MSEKTQVKASKSSATSRLKIRRPGALCLVALLAWIAAWPLGISFFTADSPLPYALSLPTGAIILGTPLLVAHWAWRSGVDVTTDGLTVRGFLSERMVPWSAIDGFAINGDGVSAILSNQTLMPLPPMKAAALPTVIKVGGQSMATEPVIETRDS